MESFSSRRGASSAGRARRASWSRGIRLLHVLDGDATRPRFEAAAIPGEVVVWREALIEGPWPRVLRGVDDVLAAIGERAATDEEVVLWFDEDLFCRLDAAYLAHRFPMTSFTNATGAHAGDVAAAFARRARLDPATGAVWSAYVASDPRAIVPLATRFPWLRLHLARFPHARDGLNTIERRVLEALRAHGPMSLDRLLSLVATGDLSAASWGLTDVALEAELHALAPLVEASGEGYALTRAGEAVLAGRADRTELAPLDRWVGGVHLTGRGAWRWDGGRLVATNPEVDRV